MIFVVVRGLLALEDGSHTHTGTNAHGGQTELLALALQLGHQGGDLAGTGASQGVAHGDGTTVGVDLLQRKTAGLNGVDSLGSESLVQLENIDILDLLADLLEDSGDSNGGTNAHDARRASNNGGGDELADNGESELLGGLALHQENSGGTIGNLGGVTSGGGTIEGRAELGQALDGGTGTDTIILGDNDLLLVTLGILDDGLDGDDLVIELALSLSAGGLLEGKGSELVLLLTGNVEVGGDVLGGDTLESKGGEGNIKYKSSMSSRPIGHIVDRKALKRSKGLPHGELAVGSSLRGLRDLLGGLGGHGRGTVSHGHGLNTGTDTDVNQTSLDVGGDADNGLQSRGALTVGGVDGGLLGVSGIESSHAGDGGTTGSLENVTNADIVNDGGVDLVALLDGDEDGSQKVLTILFLGDELNKE